MVIPINTSDATKYEIKPETCDSPIFDCPILKQTQKLSLWVSLPQAGIALSVANTDALALSIAVVGAPIPLGITGALYAVLESGESGAIGGAATVLSGNDGDWLGVTPRAFELVEVLVFELERWE